MKNNIWVIATGVQILMIGLTLAILFSPLFGAGFNEIHCYNYVVYYITHHIIVFNSKYMYVMCSLTYI